MKISIRWKLFILVAGFNILVAFFLAYTVYNVSYKLFFDNFLKSKLQFAKSLSAGIDGNLYMTIDSLNNMQTHEYTRIQEYLHKLKVEDSTISYLYTLSYNRCKDQFSYTIDADNATENILWVETSGFAFEIHFDTLMKPFIVVNQEKSLDSIKFRTANNELITLRLEDNGGRCTVLLNNAQLASFAQNSASERVEFLDKEISFSCRHMCFNMPINGKMTTLHLSLSPRDQPFSSPGDLYSDDDKVLSLYRDILSQGKDSIDSTFKMSNYGRCMSAYGVIRNSKNESVGLVVVDFYERELSVLKSSVTRVSIIISIIAIIMVLIVLPILLEVFVIKHIKKLNSGMKLMGDRNFETRITIRSNDEFECLANGFNSMASNLREFYEHLDELVKDRTTVIEQQNEELQVQTDNLVEINDLLNDQNKILHSQKDKIEAQNTQIVSSITYAKRIQSALLQSQEAVDKLLPDNFILYKPRDIVSGDFYYIREIGDTILIIAADCTGHGVPGAFMSLLGISFLNEIVQNKDISRTDTVLNQLRDKIIQTFGLTGNRFDTRDGMDIAFVSLNKNTGHLQFSGAYSPLWVIRHSDQSEKAFSMLEIKGDSMPIGVHPKDCNKFTMHEMTLEKGDVFYLFSDGYISQFGGEIYARYKTCRMRETIKEIYHLPMAEQKRILKNNLNAWKGESEQTDDVLFIGVRMT